MNTYFKYSYQIEEQRVQEIHISDADRPVKNLADLQLKFDKTLTSPDSGTAAFLFKVRLVRKHANTSGRDAEIFVRLQIDFHCSGDQSLSQVATSDDLFWFPLVQDLYLIAQDRARVLASGLTSVSFPTPLSITDYKATCTTNSD